MKRTYIIVLVLLFLIPFVIASSSDGGVDISFAGLILMAGPVFYWLQTVRYSGLTKRHFHEKETQVAIDNLQFYDNFVSRVNKSTKSSIGQYESPFIPGAGKSMPFKLARIYHQQMNEHAKSQK